MHDDAFVISEEDGSTIALEPAYFDKTNDYPAGHREQKYFVAVQNCGAALDKEGHLRLVTEDIRNGNGRTIKSRFQHLTVWIVLITLFSPFLDNEG